MELGTAKPTPAERALVPHHLLDLYDPDQPAPPATTPATPATSSPTSPPPPSPSSPAAPASTSARCSTASSPPPPPTPPSAPCSAPAPPAAAPPHLHRTLARFDPRAATLIHPNDTPKAIRAIEVSLAARRPITELIPAAPAPCALL